MRWHTCTSCPQCRFLIQTSQFRHCNSISLQNPLVYLFYPKQTGHKKVTVFLPLSPFGNSPACSGRCGWSSARGRAAWYTRCGSATASDAKPGEVDGLVHWDSVTNVQRRVADELGAVAVDHLSVARLRGIGVVLRETNAQHVRPLQEGLCQVLIVESRVDGSVPAVKRFRRLIHGKRYHKRERGTYISILGRLPVYPG